MSYMSPQSWCRCENLRCWHEEWECPAVDGLRPAPVQYLYGEPMCEPCITTYIEAGYGKS